MSTDRVIDRVRAANPAPTTPIADDELFARIVAGPGDPRLCPSKPRRRRVRRVGLIVAALVFSATGGAVADQLGAFSHASPKALFEANPAGQYSRRPGRTTGTGQTVIPRTVHRATTFTIPGVGRFEWWIGISKPSGWLCGAIRQPDGTWADLGTGDKYQLGGPMPGCGTLPWHDAEGFAYNQTSVQSPNGRMWRIAYGYAPATGGPVMIRDEVSGATAPIGERRYFAIVMPLCSGQACANPAGFRGYRLVTLDAAGRVLATDQYDPGM
ncbi:MAG TPA: hypothetical protein VMB27_13180 [Solirubrobacteraceae bacterium]|nr:hypothetical protein [Solirubrobacteraceae bacterium]